jgi:hypothetical protein
LTDTSERSTTVQHTDDKTGNKFGKHSLDILRFQHKHSIAFSKKRTIARSVQRSGAPING